MYMHMYCLVDGVAIVMVIATMVVVVAIVSFVVCGNSTLLIFIDRSQSGLGHFSNLVVFFQPVFWGVNSTVGHTPLKTMFAAEIDVSLMMQV